MLGLKCWGHTASLCPLSATNKLCSRGVCFCCPAAFIPMCVCVWAWRGAVVFACAYKSITAVTEILTSPRRSWAGREELVKFYAQTQLEWTVFQLQRLFVMSD